MDEDVDGHAADGGERGHDPQRVFAAEAEDVLALADDDEGLKKDKDKNQLVVVDVPFQGQRVLRNISETISPHPIRPSISHIIKKEVSPFFLRCDRPTLDGHKPAGRSLPHTPLLVFIDPNLRLRVEERKRGRGRQTFSLCLIPTPQL